MLVCPLCEHTQERGHECDACGKRLLEAAAVSVPLVPLDGIEPTLAAPVEVDALPLAELEPTAVAVPQPRAGRAPPPTACRYCGAALAAGEAFCATCGMKLSFPPTPPAATPVPERRCRVCGARFAGEACPACGARHGGG